MRLELHGKSKKRIGYVPDWIQILYKKDNKFCNLTLDIQGNIAYNKESLDCACKGELIPWTYSVCGSSKEVNFYDIEADDAERMFPDEKIIEIFEKGLAFMVGVYPCKDEFLEASEDDEITDCFGFFERNTDNSSYSKKFKFDTEINL